MLGDSIVRRPGFGRLHAGVPSRKARSFQTVSSDRVLAQDGEQPSIDRAHKAIPTIDRDVVAVPELLLDAEQLATDPRAYLAPIVNGLWQAGGRLGCPRYKEDGTYDEMRSYS
jgi:hypothetical protein